MDVNRIKNHERFNVPFGETLGPREDEFQFSGNGLLFNVKPKGERTFHIRRLWCQDRGAGNWKLGGGPDLKYEDLSMLVSGLTSLKKKYAGK